MSSASPGHGLGGHAIDTTRDEAVGGREAIYRLAFENSTEGIILFDCEWRVLDGNPRICELLGYSIEQLLRLAVEDIFPPGERAELKALCEQVLAGQTVLVENEITRKGGGAFPAEVSARFVAAGKILAVVRDVSERKRAEEALHRSEEQLMRAQKMESVGTLAAGIAHDFNNLLTAIIGYSDLAIRQLGEGDSAREKITHARTAAERAAELTKQLLAFTRQQKLDFTPVDLNRLVPAHIKILRRVIREDVEISFAPTPGLRAIMADPRQIEHVLMNLVKNASDAVLARKGDDDRPKRIIIEVRNAALDESYARAHVYALPGEYVCLSVSDTGAGIDARIQPRIFEPFFTTKEIGKGTGLGLPMVYGVVRQHGGTVEVYSEPGRGAAFKLYLPVTEDEAVEASAHARAVAPGRGETILVAEDEEPLRRLLTEILESGLGYKVITARDGAQALGIFLERREEIDLVLLDVVMPNMGGPEAYTQMREAAGDVPVIFMTGYSAAMARSGMIEGSKKVDDPVIQKPYTVEGIAAAVREVLDERAAG